MKKLAQRYDQYTAFASFLDRAWRESCKSASETLLAFIGDGPDTEDMTVEPDLTPSERNQANLIMEEEVDADWFKSMAYLILKEINDNALAQHERAVADALDDLEGTIFHFLNEISFDEVPRTAEALLDEVGFVFSNESELADAIEIAEQRLCDYQQEHEERVRWQNLQDEYHDNFY